MKVFSITSAMLTIASLVQADTCSRTLACGPDEYCSAGICRIHGTCDAALDCKNPANEYMTTACVGFLTCTNNKCLNDCSTGSICPSNDLTLNCAEDPCQTPCAEDYDFCTRDFCGGCNAIFINAAGEQVCKPDLCPGDPHKTEPGYCGCGNSELDLDKDGAPDCVDECKYDYRKTEPGYCGCYLEDTDSDG
jgi:hypothetical protein